MSELNVLVPTRSRPHSIAKIVDAWHHTGAFGVASLIFVVDKDDATYREYHTELNRHPEALSIWMNEWHPLVQKLNYAARMMVNTGMAMAFMGDDHLPRTEMWAHRALAATTLHGPSIVYGRDGFQDRRLPTWWVMTNSIVDALGRMVPADVQHLYCDNAILQLGQAANCLRYLPDVLIEHMHPIAGKGEMDPQYARVNRRQQYDRDRAAFEAWVKDGLARDASLIADLRG